MNRRMRNLLIAELAIAAVGAAAIAGFAFGQDKPVTPSMEEHMVSDTDAVLTILRTWHNQISQDQAIIKAQAQRIEAVTTIPPGDAGQQLRWKDTKWEWFTPPPPADKPVEAPAR